MKHSLHLLMLILFANFSNAQTPDYPKLWNTVERYEIEGLTQSAMKSVAQIEQLATKDKNTQQLIKTMLFKSKFALILEEDAQLKIIKGLKEQITKSEFPTKNILESLLANLYWQYFNKNRWQFYNRTKTSEKVDQEDFRTWDLQTLFAEIHLHYQNSLLNGLLLQQEPLENYSMLLHEQEGSKIYRPTLFDFISHNALEFYKTSETHITKPAYKFEIDNPDFLADAERFSTLKIESKDSTSLQLHALKIYNSLTRFHLKSASPFALADVNIERLKFVNQHATFANKQTILLNILKSESKILEYHEVSGLYDFEIASIYYNDSQQYQPDTTDEHRWKAKEAIDICYTIIEKFPNSKGAEKCGVLTSQIKQQTLQITTEQFLPIQKNARVLIRFKNIDSLQFYIYKISRTQLKKFNSTYRKDEQLQFIKRLKTTEFWHSALKNEGDYQTHSTEVQLPKLNNGTYLMFSSIKNDEDTFAFSTVQVTNLALVETDSESYKTFQIIDRNNGQPIENGNIELSYNENNTRNNQKENQVTDALGQIKIKKSTNRYRNITAKVNHDNDLAYFGEYYINKRYKQNEEDLTFSAFLFTDRSIYRPGQTVFFKAIAMKTEKGKSEVLPNENVYAVLYNTNDEEVKELQLKTNEFGSVSGEFILPNTGLNGEYYIEFDGEEDGLFTEHYFSVEEYKRPKFETKINPITETFKINDSVTVKGYALAYAGSNITDAKVVYRVHRKVEYPRWYFWYRPSFHSEPQEITHGESTTNSKGEFEITFKAIPDQSVDKSSSPIFKYEVTADVTDLNGETRSATTVVNVGYHVLVANLSIENPMDKAIKDQTISIDTKNLNGQFVPAKGTIKVYKLQTPKHVLRQRPWAAPDYKGFSENTFKNLFPHEAYANEQNPENWEKGDLVLEKDFDTELSKKVKLGRIKKWESGKYIITLESQDKFGQPVKDEIKTTLYSKTDETIADNQLFSITSSKPSYNPDENAIITLASAAENVTVTVHIEKDHDIINTHIIHLNNNLKTISIPITPEDIGGFAIHYSYAAFNSFQSGNLTINVPYPKTKLDIETTTFRNKLQPGTDETWSFKIKGPKGEQVSAELLASMYDASLDQFKPHDWSFNPIQKPIYYSYNYGNANQSFGTRNFRVYNNSPRVHYSQQHYDQWNWYGFSFNNNHWQYSNYLSKIRSKYKSKHEDTYDSSIKPGFVSGTVYDINDIPLVGVIILVKGTSKGVVTDLDGNFTIEASQKDILTISYIGFSDLELKLDKNNRLKINLVEDSEALDEVVVVGYGTQKKSSITGAVSRVMASEMEEDTGITNLLSGQVPGVSIQNDSETPGAVSNISIRGTGSIDSKNTPLYVVDGVIVEGELNISPNDIQSVEVLKDAAATAIYGSKGANGVIIITTKKGLNALTQVKVRKNLQETAFFFPQLKTDESGNISFNFTTPEALTQWKLQLLTHTKTLESATRTLSTVTQKELMVIPNAPRFLREGDSISISTKIANLTENQLSGQALLVLTDAISGKDISQKLIINSDNALPLGEIAKPERDFSVDAKGNTQVSWKLYIPEGIDAVQYKIIAKSKDFSDGEQNALPVLSNRMLVTETLPMWIRSNQTKTFSLDKLKTNTSTTLKHHKLTLEITSNPSWYAVQALPYLMEYPYECNEQTFSRYYANALASHIANSNPRIQDVFNQWASQDALISNLEKNEELKSILIQETPWLRDAQSETEQKKRIGLLFNLNKMNNELQSAITKLKANQMHSGGWSWFNGGRENRYITQHIINGFGHLSKLGVTLSAVEESQNQMIKKAIEYLDAQFIKEYEDIRKYNAEIDLSKDHLSHTQLHYLYMRSFYPEIKKSKEVETIIEYYQTQIQKYWLSRSLYSKGLMALVSHRNNDSKTANKILRSLKETSITSEELGMYWKANTNSWYWYQAPIETQALLIEAFSEIENDTETIDNLKIWLLKNKQTNRWKTTKATTEAVYALLLQGSDWLSVTDMVDVVIGGQNIDLSKLEEVKVEAGTGYYKTSWDSSEIKPDMGEVMLTKKGDGIAWGSLYWQYFEDLDHITSADLPAGSQQHTLKLKKKLFLKTNTDTGEEITEITSDTKLNLGDLVRVRIELRSDRTMEFLHMKDMRASGLEPVNVISEYKWQDGLGYYESTKDASTNFFFDYLPKGIYVFEYDLRVNNAGNMSNGITTIQSMYAPEFSSHSEGARINID